MVVAMADGSQNQTCKSIDNQHRWPTGVLPAALHSQGIRCIDQTPASARQLLSRGRLNAEDFLETSPDIERTLMEAYVEDDYEGRLHLTTLSIISTSTSQDDDNAGKETTPSTAAEDGEIVGMAFWREVPSDEMNEWMDLRRISKAVADRTLASSVSTTLRPSALDDREHHHRDCLSHDAMNTMKLVKSDSIRWIENALQPCEEKNDGDGPPRTTIDDRVQSAIQKLTHSWIKIELIAVKRTHRAHRLGGVLLGCTLARAHATHHNEHAILHVAGGGASKNVPAARLYARYGFASVPRHEEGGPFAKPDRDLFVLGNIGMVLNALPWEETIQVGCAEEDYGDDKDDYEGLGDNEHRNLGGKRQSVLQDQK